MADASLYLLPPFVAKSGKERGDSLEEALEALLEEEYPADQFFTYMTRVSYTSKSSRPCFIKAGYTVLGLQAGKPCRLSRELGATVFCKELGVPLSGSLSRPAPHPSNGIRVSWL